MITIQSGKLNIPEEDRFVGFAGDNLGSCKRFVIPNRGNDSGIYTLCLRFDDDSVRVISLAKSLSEGDLVLTWQIQSAHLLKAGIVMAQIKSVDSDDVIMHSSCDYFIVANSADLAEDGEVEYVTREEYEERLTDFIRRVRESAPYIGEDGYWHFYDVETDSYTRGAGATPIVDASFVDNSINPVQSRVIKAFVESAVDSKVSKTTRIAGLPLSGNISQADLVMNLSGSINPPIVIPEQTLGYGGQYGKTIDGDPVMCVLGTSWIKLARDDSLTEKMDKTPDVTSSDVDSLPSGQLFLCQGSVALKTAAGYLELAKAANVYSKAEINSMIGGVETLLSQV